MMEENVKDNMNFLRRGISLDESTFHNTVLSLIVKPRCVRKPCGSILSLPLTPFLTPRCILFVEYCNRKHRSIKSNSCLEEARSDFSIAFHHFAASTASDGCKWVRARIRIIASSIVSISPSLLPSVMQSNEQEAEVPTKVGNIERVKHVWIVTRQRYKLLLLHSKFLLL